MRFVTRSTHLHAESPDGPPYPASIHAGETETLARSAAASRGYGIRRTEESSISLICSMISRASDHSRCHTLRP
jgi:hypothetical protein